MIKTTKFHTFLMFFFVKSAGADLERKCRISNVPVLTPAFLIGADSKPTYLRAQEELDNKLGHFSV